MPGPTPHRGAFPARAMLAGLVFGCVTTILSAWLICLLTTSPSPAAGAGMIVHDPAGPKVVFAGRSLARAELLWHPDDGFRSDPPEPDLSWNRTPRWMHRAIRAAPPQTIYLAAGWPALAMHMTVRDVDPAVLRSDYEADGGLLLEYRKHGRRAGIPLPLTPHWPAFIFNTILYGAWWALALSAITASRRRLSPAPDQPAAPPEPPTPPPT